LTTVPTEFGFAIDGTESPRQIRELVAAIEAHGAARRLWIASHLFHREPIALAGAVLGQSHNLGIALTAVSPYIMHPAYCAMAAATLDEMFPGRVTLCLGVGAPRDLECAGIEPAKPIRVMREALNVVAGLLNGDTIQHDGEIFRVRNRCLSTGSRRVPLLLAASGPQMLQLAGSVADGVVISAGTSPEFIRSCLYIVAESERRSGRRVRRVGYVYTSTHLIESQAYARLRRPLAFILRGAHHARNLEMAGSKLDQDALAQAFIGENWGQVEEMITDEVVRRHAASGTAQQVADRIKAYQAAGLDEIVLIGPTESNRPGDLPGAGIIAHG
jgi:5,10-methylenetetrahydromethanopterin reductase